MKNKVTASTVWQLNKEQISQGGEEIHGLEKVLPREFVPHGTNFPREKFPRNKVTGEQIPSYTGTYERWCNGVQVEFQSISIDLCREKPRECLQRPDLLFFQLFINFLLFFKFFIGASGW